jgi:hypothetical protein
VKQTGFQILFQQTKLLQKNAPPVVATGGATDSLELIHSN